jgi:hypothetical protein
MPNKSALLPICAGLPIAVLMAGALIHGQSLADAARKAEEDKAPATKSYSNKDLVDAEPAAPPPSTQAAAPPARTTVTPEVRRTSREGVRDETYWRARVAPLNQRIRENTTKAIPLQRRVDELTQQLADIIGPPNARRGRERERQRLITQVQQLENARRTQEAELARIEEEGRRAGALPGWFRPRQ